MQQRMDAVVANASHIYLDRGVELAGGWIAVRHGRVAAYGDSGTPAPPADRVIDAGGRVVTPGLINTHHHIYQNLTRSFGPAVNGTLFGWLTTLYPMWARLDQDGAYYSAYVGIAELLLGGCTTSTDHLYVHPRPGLIDAEIRAAQDIGFRFYPTRGSMSRSEEDGYLPPRSVVQKNDVILEDSERLIRAYHDPSPGALIRVALAPCSPFSVDDDLMRATAELSERHGVRMHTHLAEDPDEDSFCLGHYGRTPVEHFEDVGWANDRSWVAHFAYPSDAESKRLAKAGVGVAHCPSSNMVLCGATANVPRLRSYGMPVGLGCDGSASADAASLWMEARGALMLARFVNGAGAFTARDALDVGTRGSAACLGWEDEIGHLTVGALADLVVWDMASVSLAGALDDPIEALLRCGPATAWTTMVGGRVLVDGGELQLPGLPDALREHRRIAADLQRAL
ncbi:8-oxoguanine deaminase [Naasia sp. SYSU D00948]|uniref:8-oxoguanine deaminase n=1 Tax=Naasia sp. SYSU D00948 TaxID=2817379 RepID=UPI001B3044CB|nr:8-oxoguanine deaminase [Naasia sp. SYSU D00948]